MTSPAGGNELGTVFINVAPKMSGLSNQFLAAGREGAKAFNQGFTEGMKGVSLPADGSILGEVIAGKPVGSATRSAAQKAGKEIGTGLNTGINEGMKTAPSTGGGVISDVLAGKAGSWATRNAAEQAGKTIGAGINKGIEDAAKSGKKIDDIIAGGAPEEAGTTLGTKIGKAVLKGLQAMGPETGAVIGKALAEASLDFAEDKIPGFRTFEDMVGNLSDKSRSVVDSFTGLKDAINATKAHDLAGAMGGLQDALKGAEPVAKLFGADISSWSGTLADAGPKLEDAGKNIKGMFTGDIDTRAHSIAESIRLMGSVTGNNLDGIAADVEAIGGAAGGVIAIKDAFSALGPVLAGLASPEILAALGMLVAVGGSFAFPIWMAQPGQRPINWQIAPQLGPPIEQTPAAQMPLPGQLPPAEIPKGAPPGTTYQTSTGDMGVFSGLLPPGWTVTDGQLVPPGAKPVPTTGGAGTGVVPPGLAPLDTGGYGLGGQVTGSGGDMVPIWAHLGEYVMPVRQTGQFRPLLDAMRSYQEGGVVGPDVAAADAMAGTPYSQGNRTDCSGMVARVVDRAMGLPVGDLMSTKNASSWLAARGFTAGAGGPGDMSVYWYDRGPNPNDGHMVIVLSNGQIAQAGGNSNSFQVGAKVNLSQFDHVMHHRAGVFGEGAAGGTGTTTVGGGAGAGAGGGGAAGTAGGGGGGGDAMFQQLGQALVTGGFQELGFGEGGPFGKPPTQWGITRMGMAGLNYLLGLAKTAGMFKGAGLSGPGGALLAGIGAGAGLPPSLLSGGGGPSPAGLIASAAATQRPGSQPLGAPGAPGGNTINLNLPGAVIAGQGAARELSNMTVPNNGLSGALAPSTGAAGLPG